MATETNARLAKAFIVVVAVVALYPVAQTAIDWIRVSQIIATPLVDAGVRSYDWVEWEDTDGLTTARYVHRGGPGAKAGIEQGDELYLIDYQQYFTDELARTAIQGVAPGEVVHYTIVRGDDHVNLDVRLTRYPTFLYPRSQTLWQFSLWGFAIAAFVHVLGLIVAVPLARRSRDARSSLVLIAVSAVWIFGNLARILAVAFLGAPESGSRFDSVLHASAVVSLVGWIAFPALLNQRVLGRAFPSVARSWFVVLVYVPTIVLVLIAGTAVVSGALGPFTLDELVGPILFYASCYIALASALILLARGWRNPETDEIEWSYRGSQVVLVVAVLAALTIMGVVPVLTASGQARAGWFVVFAQLLSTAPVILVSLATLRYGRVDAVVRRALAYTLTGGILFFLFVVGLGLIDQQLAPESGGRNVIGALFAVMTLFLVDRGVRAVMRYASSLFPSERQRTAQLLSQFQDSVRDVVALPDLLKETIERVGEAFHSRSAVIFVQSPTSPDDWISANYHPEPPYITESFVRNIWPHFAADGQIWAHNAELDRSAMPSKVSSDLAAHGAAVAAPIVGREGAIGVVILGRKRERSEVFNLDDIDQLRWLSTQLALAVERVKLVERQNMLTRETAQAQLVALRSQINPHFLFNALNTIMALIEEKPDDAERTLEHLAAIFRHILNAGDRTFVSVDEELTLVRHYLAIEKARFGDKLVIEEQIEQSARAFPVPAFAIQTLVENAVKHGIEKKIDGGTITVDVSRPNGTTLSILVKDTGIGIPELFGSTDDDGRDRDYFGIGLNNVVTRVEQLYGRDDIFSITSIPGEGTSVRLRIPIEDQKN